MPTAAQLSENSHQGVDGLKAALCLGSTEAKSNTASGMPVCLWREGIGSRSSGKERDAETGLDYFLARYYSGAQGRFISPDEWKGGPDDALTGRDIIPPGPLPYADIANPQTLNKYTYTINNPLRYVDPDGHDFWDFVNGAANAFSTDFFAGVGRQDPVNGDYASGQKFGDAAAVVGGAIETVLGFGGEVGGLALDATGVGALVGVPAGMVSTAAIVQGGAAVGTGAGHLLNTQRRANDFTQSDKKQIQNNNAAANGGKNVCANCGVETVPAKKSEKGVRPPGNERQHDHIKPVSKGGTRKIKNGQILCRDCNLEKSDNF